MPSLRKRRQKNAKRCFCPCLLVWKSKGLDLEFHNPGSWELECLRSRRTLEIGLGTLNWQNRQGPVASAVLLLGSFRQVSTACRFLPVPMVEVEVVVLVLVNSNMVDGAVVSSSHPQSSLSVYLLQDEARQSMAVGVAQHGPGHEQTSSTCIAEQGIILRSRPIGRGWSSANNATGRRKVRRLVPDQVPGQWALVVLLASCITRAGFTPAGSWSLLPSLQKTPSGLLQSQPIISFSSPSRLQPSKFKATKPAHQQIQPLSSHLPPCLCGAVSYRVLSQLAGVSKYIHSQIPNPERAEPDPAKKGVPAFNPSAI